MTKYHVVPKTGQPKQCYAGVRPCPYGAIEHGATPGEARDHYEQHWAALDPFGTQLSDTRLQARYIDLYTQIADAKAELRKSPANKAELQKDIFNAQGLLDHYQLEMEKAGKGHLIPDMGRSTLRVASMAQKVLWEDKLVGQISDGKWENTGPKDAWQAWSRAEVIVDPANVGRNFHAAYDSYAFNSQELWDIIGGEMKSSLQEAGLDLNENEVRRELSALSKLKKNTRYGELKAPSPAAPQAEKPARKAPVRKPAVKSTASAPTRPAPKTSKAAGGFTSSYSMNMGTTAHSNPSMVAVAMAGPGSQKAPARLAAKHQGTAAAAEVSGPILILGKADGTRARIVKDEAGSIIPDPGANMGRAVTLSKARTNGRPEDIELHVLGYRDAEGNSFGYLPKKKVHFFQVG